MFLIIALKKKVVDMTGKNDISFLFLFGRCQDSRYSIFNFSTDEIFGLLL